MPPAPGRERDEQLTVFFFLGMGRFGPARPIPAPRRVQEMNDVSPMERNSFKIKRDLRLQRSELQEHAAVLSGK
jgi:hypothetical protein